MTERTGRLRRSDRLRRSRDFQRVARQGRRVASSYFVLLVAPAFPGVSAIASGTLVEAHQKASQRLGVTVSRKVGNAVVRNRVKRGIRKWFRTERESLTANVDVVVIARAAAAGLSDQLLREELRCLAVKSSESR